MKQRFIWMLAAVMICGLISFTFTSCSNDDNTSESQMTPEKLMPLLEGNWYIDADGNESISALFVELQLNSKDQSMLRFVGYDVENDLFNDFSLPITHKVVAKKDGNYLNMYYDIEALREMFGPEIIGEGDDEGLEPVELKIGNVTGDELTIADYDEETQETATEIFKKGTIDISKLDATPIKEILAYQKEHEGDLLNIYKGENDYLEAPETNEEAVAGSCSQTRAASTTRNYARWMKDIPDAALVRNLCLPSAHDAATMFVYLNNQGSYVDNIKATIFRSMGVSQTLGFSDQFRTGVRVFDLRVRIAHSDFREDVPKHLIDRVCLYHDLLPANYTLEAAIQNITASIYNNLTEGAIIMVSAEGSQLAKTKEEKNATPIFSEGFWTGYGKYVANLLLGSGSGSPIDKAEIWKETMKILKSELADENLLATFTPDMTMADLRGKVMVLCDGVPSGTDYLGMKDKLCLRTTKDKEAVLMSADGQHVVKYIHQNSYEPNGNEKSNQDKYADRKVKEFGEYIQIGHDNTEAWVANDCNGYYWDGPVPNYAVFAQNVYPRMIPLMKKTRTRGIFQQDFIGTSRFGRTDYDVIIAKAKEDWGIVDGNLETKVKSFFTSLFERAYRTFIGILDENKLNFLTMPKLEDALQNPKYYDVYGEALTRSIIENNFSSDDNP